MILFFLLNQALILTSKRCHLNVMNVRFVESEFFSHFKLTMRFFMSSFHRFIFNIFPLPAKDPWNFIHYPSIVYCFDWINPLCLYLTFNSLQNEKIKCLFFNHILKFKGTQTFLIILADWVMILIIASSHLWCDFLTH